MSVQWFEKLYYSNTNRIYDYVHTYMHIYMHTSFDKLGHSQRLMWSCYRLSDLKFACFIIELCIGSVSYTVLCYHQVNGKFIFYVYFRLPAYLNYFLFF